MPPLNIADPAVFESLPDGPEIPGLLNLHQKRKEMMKCTSGTSQQLDVSNAQDSDFVLSDTTLCMITSTPKRSTHPSHRETAGTAESVSGMSIGPLQECVAQLQTCISRLENMKDSECPNIDETDVDTFVENGKRKYQCRHCGFTRITKSAVQGHFWKVHLRKKETRCNFCSFKSFNPSSLSKHMNSCKTRYRCEKCSYTSTRKYDLLRHKQSKKCTL